MVKRRFRKKNTRRYKKRTYKKSYRRFKKTSYDGTYYVKAGFVKNLCCSGTVGQNYAFMAVSWGAIGLTDNWNAYMDDAQEIVINRLRYKQYKITGIKIEVMPLSQVDYTTSGNAFSGMSYCTDATDQVPIATPAAQLVQYTGFRNRQFKYMKKYINVGKFFAKRNQNGGWLPTTTGYSQACSVIRVDHGGAYAPGDVVGRVSVTWYVKFRQPVAV